MSNAPSSASAGAVQPEGATTTWRSTSQADAPAYEITSLAQAIEEARDAVAHASVSISSADSKRLQVKHVATDKAGSLLSAKEHVRAFRRGSTHGIRAGIEELDGVPASTLSSMFETRPGMQGAVHQRSGLSADVEAVGGKASRARRRSSLGGTSFTREERLALVQKEREAEERAKARRRRRREGAEHSNGRQAAHAGDSYVPGHPTRAPSSQTVQRGAHQARASLGEQHIPASAHSAHARSASAGRDGQMQAWSDMQRSGIPGTAVEVSEMSSKGSDNAPPRSPPDGAPQDLAQPQASSGSEPNDASGLSRPSISEAVPDTPVRQPRPRQRRGGSKATTQTQKQRMVSAEQLPVPVDASTAEPLPHADAMSRSEPRQRGSNRRRLAPLGIVTSPLRGPVAASRHPTPSRRAFAVEPMDDGLTAGRAGHRLSRTGASREASPSAQQEQQRPRQTNQAVPSMDGESRALLATMEARLHRRLGFRHDQGTEHKSEPSSPTHSRSKKQLHGAAKQPRGKSSQKLPRSIAKLDSDE